MKNDIDFNDPDLDEMLEKQNAMKSKPIHKIYTPKSKTVSPNHAKRQARRKQSAEDFTPSTLINEMLDKLPKDQWKENITFCDPACGNGNMLVEVLKRKLSFNHNPTEALKTIYGTDIMLDNIKECRLRLLKVVVNHINSLSIIIQQKHSSLELVKILGKNIVCTPLDKYPNGSLDYDFDFKYTPTDLQAKQGLQKILKEKLLDTVTI